MPLAVMLAQPPQEFRWDTQAFLFIAVLVYLDFLLSLSMLDSQIICGPLPAQNLYKCILT